MQYMDLDLIMANPWQTRTQVLPEHVRVLAASIKERFDANPEDPQCGLLQVPQARPHPDGAGLCQLAFGHHRLAAFQMLLDAGDQRFTQMPLQLSAFTDREMSDLAAIENAARADLSPVEKATAIQKRMADFKLSQLEAGQVFGYKSQGAVSNLLRLLDLPPEVQAKVTSGELPERAARQLIDVARVSPKAAIKAMTAALGVSEELRDRELDYQVGDALAHTARRLSDYSLPWPVDWPEQPISAEIVTLPVVAKFGEVAARKSASPHGDLQELRSCQGCPFRMKQRYDEWCTRPTCYDHKRVTYVALELQQLAKKLQVPVLAEAEVEAARCCFTGEYSDDQRDKVKRALDRRDASLRLCAFKNGNNNGWSRKSFTGSESIALASVDLPALLKVAEEDIVDHAEAQRRDREAHAQRVQTTRSILVRGAELLGVTLPKDAALLELLAFGAGYDLFECLDDGVPFAWLVKGVDETGEPDDLVDDMEGFKTLTVDQQRTLLMFHLLELAVGYSYLDKSEQARETVAEWARRLKVKLPANWHKLDGAAAKRGRPAKGAAKAKAKKA